MTKILVTDGIEKKGLDILLAEGFDVDVHTKLDCAKLLEKLKSGTYEGIIIRSATKLTPEVLQETKGLKVIGRQGIGVDNVHLETASQKGIYVMNTPGSNRHSVKQLVFSFIHHVFDQVHVLNPKTREGEFPKKLVKRKDMMHASISIVGIGAIGFEVALLAK